MKTVFNFLKQLDQHNDRKWFKSNKDKYEGSEAIFKDLVGDIADKLGSHDLLDENGTKVYRIYRDVRFSKDKTPYNIHRSAHFTRAGEDRRGGYYLRIQGGSSLIAGGFWRPNPDDLLLIRKQIDQDPDTLRDILAEKEMSNYFGKLQGERVKTSPKGFSIDNPAIDHIRHKGFVLSHTFTNKEVMSEDFSEKVSEGFRKMRPFLDYMTEIVTTDLNGTPLKEL